MDIHAAATAIRKRLFNLLFQSFLAVIILILILVLGAIFFIFYRVNNYYLPFRPMLSTSLEAYYAGRGSWDGVGMISPRRPRNLPNMEQNEWWDSVLLDENNRILVDHGTTDTPHIGQVYRLAPGETPVVLMHDNRPVGTLIITRSPSSIDAFNTLILPFGTITIFLAILTLIIGMLLSQRLITPLAEVIAASRAVTMGNLTARVKVQGPDDLRVLSDSFNQMAGELEKNDRKQRGLIADIAHELRTPLSIIQGKLEGIVDGIYPADCAHVQPILQETRQLEGLITDLDMLAQADSNQLTFNRTTIQLEKLAQQAVKSFEAEACEKKITLSCKSQKKLPTVMGDPQRVSQVINNLLANAIRYIPEGGSIFLHAEKVQNGTQLSVSDNGPGIPEEDLPKIFDRFWRGEKSRSRAHGGAGLGLAIARQFIENQGGHIFAENRPEGGLVVRFVLPEANQKLE